MDASQLDEEHIRLAFERIDTTHAGYVTKSVLGQTLASRAGCCSWLAGWLAVALRTHSSFLSTLPACLPLACVCRENFAELCGVDMSAEQVEAMFAEVDLDRDGRLNYPEVSSQPATDSHEGDGAGPDLLLLLCVWLVRGADEGHTAVARCAQEQPAVGSAQQAAGAAAGAEGPRLLLGPDAHGLHAKGLHRLQQGQRRIIQQQQHGSSSRSHRAAAGPHPNIDDRRRRQSSSAPAEEDRPAAGSWLATSPHNPPSAPASKRASLGGREGGHDHEQASSQMRGGRGRVNGGRERGLTD